MKIFRYFLFLLIVPFISLLNVNALEEVAGTYEAFSSGDSLNSYVKIGSNYVGSDYIYWINNGSTNESILSLNSSNMPWFKLTSDKYHVGDTLSVPFIVQFCTNGGQKFNVYSYYTNYVDYVYDTGDDSYLTTADWGKCDVYNAFVRLNLTITETNGDVGAEYIYHLGAVNNNFYLENNVGYNIGLRYMNFIYYNVSDYNKKLEDAKKYGQNQELINGQANTNSKLDDTNSKLNDTNSKLDEAENTRKSILGTIKDVLSNIITLPKKLVELLVDALKSLFIPTESQISEVIDDSKALSENFGFVGEGVSFSVQLFTSLLNISQSTGCVDFPEFSLDFTNVDSIGHKVKFWDKKSVCLADNLWFGSNSNGIVVVRSITTILLIVVFLNFCYKAFFRVLSKESGD